MHRHPLLGALACGVITCIAAPPVRSAESGQNADGGGCNGGRSLPASEAEAGTTEVETTSGESTSETTEGAGVCGDGEVDEGEGCDDGNEVDEDGCPSGAVGQCGAAGRCGDGLVWAGMEGCDDGNEVAGDGCESDCTETPAGECGNGVKEAGEECDDGNAVDEDGCPSGAMGGCQSARCGDGLVWTGVEGCDDGNEGEEDGCPSGAVGMCLAEARCGDGFLWEGMEGCDDGNGVEEDGCPSGAMGMCAAEAVCGDGFLWEGVEGCDDGNGEDVDGCNNDCAAPRWVFLSSELVTGNLGGVAGADASCQGLADAAGLGGTYMAWLTGSDPEMAPATRFGSTEFAGWYLLPTDPPTAVARGWADLTMPNTDNPDNYLQAAILVDESGVDVGDANVWTNTTVNGMKHGDETCVEWASGSSDHSSYIGHAKIDILTDAWSISESYKCNSGGRLYCFQVEE